MDLEVLGDWNNLKGSVYHLVYAIHQLLIREGIEVRFYEGNDLLARPAPPVDPSETQESSLVNMLNREPDLDAWIQLKSTEENWTISGLIGDNLLVNFVSNAVQSIYGGRAWCAKLVTPAIVSRESLKPYIDDAPLAEAHRSQLEGVIRKVRKAYLAQPDAIQGASDEDLIEIARTVLRQLAASTPVRLETLKAEVEREIAFRFPDPSVVHQIASTLLGAMLEQAGLGPANARPFDGPWLTEASGGRINRRTTYTDNPALACNEVAWRWVPDRWTSAACVPRNDLLDALDRFLADDAPGYPLFVLVGPPSSGKSWALTDWTTRVLARRTRIVVRRENLADPSFSLGRLVGSQIGAFRPEWSDQMWKDRLRAAAADSRGPLVVVIDDPIIHAGELAVVQEAVRRLVTECKAIGARLIMACAKPTWEMSGLAQVIGPEVFPGLPRTTPGQDYEHPSPPANPTSFELSDFAPVEVQDFLNRRLPPDPAEKIAQQLRSPDFSDLSNPYLLQLYVDQHRIALVDTGQVPPRVGIDALLDRRIDDAIADVAAEIGASAEEVSTALTGVVDALWSARPNGLRPRAVTNSLEDLWGEDTASRAMASLQRRGLLTRGVEVRLGEPAIAARLFAMRLLSRYPDLWQIPVDDLRPDVDASTVVALLRSVPSALPLAEFFLSLAPGWRSAIVSGLSQGDASDARTLALLDVLWRGDGPFLDIEAIEALGRLAARSEDAWARVEALYLGDRAADHLVGARALATTINFLPERVGSAIEVRVADAETLDRRRVRHRKRRERILRHALDPLAGVRTAEAAAVGQRLLDRFASLALWGDKVDDWEFARKVDEARGMIALANGMDALQAVSNNLSSDDSETRFRAAQALRPVVFDQPLLVSEPICDAIRNEHHRGVMNQLLWDAFRLVDVAPEAVMNAVEQSAAVDWSSEATAGQALSLLSKLVDAFPDRIHRLLPPQLDRLLPNVRALHREALSFAWWRVADRLAEARPSLIALAERDLDGIDEPFRVFSLRGSAIARLGLMSLGQAQSVELIERHYLYPGWGLQFLYLWTDDFVERHASALSAHLEADRLVELLVEAVQSEDQAQEDPLNRPLLNSSFRSANLCLEALVHLAATQTDPLPLLSRLPRKHQALHVAAGLLASGRREEPLVAFVREACAEHPMNAVTSGSDQRDRCLALLARIDAQEGRPVGFHSRPRSPFGGGEAAADFLAQLTKADPSAFLRLLEEAVEEPRDLPLLYRLDEAASSSAHALIARAYRRMFDAAPIEVDEARRLCGEMIAGVTDLPASRRSDEYLAMYEEIAHRLADGPARPLELPSELPGPIPASHRWAAHVLAQRPPTDESFDDWLHALVSDRLGWWETNEFRLSGDIVQLFGDMVYVFPAVRLALIAIGTGRRPDPAGTWMADRTATSDLLADLRFVLREDDVWANQRPTALQRLRDHTDGGSRDERGWRYRGHLALLLGHYDEAIQALSYSVSLPHSDYVIRANALYDLACAFARVGDEEHCQEALLASQSSKPIDRAWLLEDPDLESYRNCPWFVELSSPSTSEESR